MRARFVLAALLLCHSELGRVSAETDRGVPVRRDRAKKDTGNQADAYMRDFDSDGNNGLSPDEMEVLLEQVKEDNHVKEESHEAEELDIDIVWALTDRDHDGIIRHQELVGLLQNLKRLLKGFERKPEGSSPPRRQMRKDRGVPFPTSHYGEPASPGSSSYRNEL